VELSSDSLQKDNSMCPRADPHKSTPNPKAAPTRRRSAPIVTRLKSTTLENVPSIQKRKELLCHVK
jgi:hypothetical protein